MSKTKKSTKKFQKKHLKGAIQKRRRRQNVTAKHASKHAAKSTTVSEQADEEQAKRSKLKDMDVDEFLDGGFMDADKGLDGGAASDDDVASDLDDDDDIIDDDTAAELKNELPAAGDDGDSEDDDEDDNDDDVTWQNNALKDEIGSHKQQLEALKKMDPEFYEYLQKTDSRLLEFGADDGGADEDDEGDDEDDDEDDEAEDRDADEAGDDVDRSDQQDATTSGRFSVTSEVVEKWCKAAQSSASLGTVRRLLKAYHAACHYGEGGDDASSAVALKISSSTVFNRVLLFMLKEADGLFRRMLGIEEKHSITSDDIGKLNRWKNVGPLVKSYIGNTLHLLGIATESNMVAFILRCLRRSIVFVAHFSRLRRKMRKQALDIFGSADNAPRLQALLLLRQMALLLPPPAIDECLKGVYRTFASNAKFVNSSSVPHINFMSACVVEMFGLDMAASYEHAFTFIRQLANLVRNALTLKTKDAFKQVYSWQGISCLELWSRVVAAHHSKAEMQPLLYPVAQLLVTAARLVPTPRYFPLRLRLVRAMNRLAEATGHFIPVAPILLEMLQWSELKRRGKPTVDTSLPDLHLQLRIGKSFLKSPAFQQELVQQVMELLAEHMAMWSCNIAFPELAHITLLQLRKFHKGSAVDRHRRAAKQLIDAIERNIVFVGRARDRVEFSPKDIAQVQQFMSEERAAKKAPLQQLAITLAAAAKARRDMQRTSEVVVGDGNAAARSDEDSDDDDAAGDAHEFNMAAAGKANAKRQKEAEVGAKKRKQPAENDADVDAGGDDDDAQDIIEDFVLSDDDNADDDDDVIADDDAVDDDDEDDGMGLDSDDDEGAIEERYAKKNQKPAQKPTNSRRGKGSKPHKPGKGKPQANGNSPLAGKKPMQSKGGQKGHKVKK